MKTPLHVALNNDRTNPYVRVQYGTFYDLNLGDYSYDPDADPEEETAEDAGSLVRRRRDEDAFDSTDPDTTDGKSAYSH